MTEKQQKYFTMYKSGMTMREIAKECGVAASTVCRTLQRIQDYEIVEEGKLSKKQKACVLAMADCDMSMTRASQEIGIVYPTFYKRIITIEKTTGLNPRCFYDLVQLIEMVKGE